MKNPLRLFYNLLLKSDILNTENAIKADDEKISIYGEDITSRISREVGLVFDRIDDEYWNNDRTMNELFFEKLINTSGKLIYASKNLFEKHKIQLLKNCAIDKWLITYNNLQAAYEGLIDIRNRITSFYLVDLENREGDQEFKLEYVHLLKESAIQLRELCLNNLGKEDTFYDCFTAEGKQCVIEVKTSKMSPLLAEMKIKELNVNSALLESLYVNSQSPRETAHVFVWNDTPKSFVQFFSPLIQKDRLLLNGSTGRDPIVKALHEMFVVNTKDSKTKAQGLISLKSLQTYFKKEASGEVY